MTFSIEAFRTKLEGVAGRLPDDVLESMCLPNPVRRHPSWMKERDAYCQRVVDAGGEEIVLRYLIDETPEHPAKVYMTVAPWGNNRVVTEAGYADSEPHANLTAISVEDAMALRTLVPSAADDALRFLWLGDEDALARFGKAAREVDPNRWRLEGNTLPEGFDALMRLFGSRFDDEAAMLDHIAGIGERAPSPPSASMRANLNAWLRREHGLPATTPTDPSRLTIEVMVIADILDALFRIDEERFPARAARWLDQEHMTRYTREDGTKFSIAQRVAELLPWQRRETRELGDKIAMVARLGGLLYEASGKPGGVGRIKCTAFASDDAADKAFDKAVKKLK